MTSLCRGGGLGVRSRDPADEDLIEEIFGFLRGIRDPEHPHTLEELAVLTEDRIDVTHLPQRRLMIAVEFCPTVPHCSLAAIIGLCISKQIGAYYPNAKLTIRVTPGSHKTETEINRQINDKERVSAAL